MSGRLSRETDFRGKLVAMIRGAIAQAGCLDVEIGDRNIDDRFKGHVRVTKDAAVNREVRDINGKKISPVP